MEEEKPVVVSPNAGALDAATAGLRYLIVILGAIPTLWALLGSRNFIGIVQYFQGAEGLQLIAAATTLGTLLYGLVKTRKRGAQIATVAGDRRVPDAVASLK